MMNTEQKRVYDKMNKLVNVFYDFEGEFYELLADVDLSVDSFIGKKAIQGLNKLLLRIQMFDNDIEEGFEHITRECSDLLLEESYVSTEEYVVLTLITGLDLPEEEVRELYAFKEMDISAYKESTPNEIVLSLLEIQDRIDDEHYKGVEQSYFESLESINDEYRYASDMGIRITF